MLSRKVRIQLIVVLVCLLGIHIFVLPPDAQTAADRQTLEEVDLLIKIQDYPQAIQLLNSALKFYPEDNAEPFLERLKTAEELNASKQAYIIAMKCYNEGDLQNALNYFKKVIPKDVERFTTAREKICELDLKVVKSVIDEKKAAAIK